MQAFTKALLACALTLGIIDTASAYVGPGVGLSLLSALWRAGNRGVCGPDICAVMPVLADPDSTS